MEGNVIASDTQNCRSKKARRLWSDRAVLYVVQVAVEKSGENYRCWKEQIFFESLTFGFTTKTFNVFCGCVGDDSL